MTFGTDEVLGRAFQIPIVSTIVERLGYVGDTSSWLASPLLEQLRPIPRLAVFGILDLRPARRFVFAVAPGAVLGDDALEVLSAYLRKQLTAVAVDVLGVQDHARMPGHDRAQKLFPLNER